MSKCQCLNVFFTDEDNWDDDFEFGSSAGSPVLGAQKRVNGTITPENPSHLDTGQRRNATSLDFQTEKGRWSSGSFEDWDAEDETINAKVIFTGSVGHAYS